MRKITALTLILFVFAVLAWKWVSAKPTDKATAETMKQLEGDFLKAASEHGSAAYLSFYADHAVELPDGADAIVGKANIAKGMGFLDDKNNHLTWSPVAASISASGDMGYTWGTYEFRSKLNDGSERVEHGKYITVWKKQGDGTWKVAVDMGNTGPKQK
jgi:ketosteroid isomerase-like protein